MINILTVTLMKTVGAENRVDQIRLVDGEEIIVLMKIRKRDN